MWAKSMLAAVALAGLSPAFAQDWPRFRSPVEEPVCTEALHIAQSAFRSNIPRLYSANTIPDDLALDRAVWSPSPGAVLSFNPSLFDEITAVDRRGIFYWQRQAYRGLRLVLVRESFNWATDRYALFAIPETATLADLQADFSVKRDSEKAFQPVIAYDFNPPVLVSDRETGAIWAIDVGPPYAVLGDWRVFTIGDAGASERCATQFRPDVDPHKREGEAWKLLPADVRELASLIDGTLGTGKNDGSLNQTARNRLAAAHAWANAALRPWVYAGADTSDRRQSTRVFLENWAHKAKSFAAHYSRIVGQYPRADAALANHYRRNFGMSDAEAIATARAAIDLSVASNY